MVEKKGNVSFVKSNNFLFHYERKKHWSGISDGWTDAYVVPFKKKKNCVDLLHVLERLLQLTMCWPLTFCRWSMNQAATFHITWIAAIRRGSKRRLLVLDSHQEPLIKYSGGEGVAPALNIAVFTHLKRPLHLLHRMWHHSAHKAAFAHLIVWVWAKFTQCNEYKDATMNLACVFESKYAYISTKTYYTAWTALETKFSYCSETSVCAV